MTASQGIVIIKPKAEIEAHTNNATKRNGLDRKATFSGLAPKKN